jgi:hypothetical protein
MCEYKELSEVAPEIFNAEGNLKQGVQILNAETGNIVAEGDKEKVEKQKNLQPGDEGFLGDDFSGDYCDVRDIFRLTLRRDIATAIGKLSVRRCLLLREHLLQYCSYHNQFTDAAKEIALIATRIMAGDTEYDLFVLPNDSIHCGEDIGTDSEEEMQEVNKKETPEEKVIAIAEEA